MYQTNVTQQPQPYQQGGEMKVWNQAPGGTPMMNYNYPPGGAPIMNYPPGGSSATNYPPGLENLARLNHIQVKQKVELLEAITGFETNNKYKIKDNQGNDIYYAVEDTDCCTRYCCGPIRPFDMKILTRDKYEAIHLYRPLACQSCCFPCCLQTLEVSAPPGNVLGTINQNWTLIKPNYSVKNANGETLYKIVGPICVCSCGGDVNFDILDLDGEKVGKIAKNWSGFVKEAFTDADNFGIHFPTNASVETKALLMGALFLIDFMYFEKSN